jgi:hypothetical protein
MYILMCLQITLVTKRLTTQIPGIWVYPSMYTLTSYSMILIIDDTLHTSQLYGCFPLFICWCVFKTPILLNDFLHTSHWYGCSPISMCWCVLRLPLLLNNLLHTTQENGSSPLCTNLCFQIPPPLNNLIHTPHLNGFSPLSMFRCLYTTHLWLNDFLRTSQWNEHSPAQWCGCSTPCIDTHFMNKSLITHITGK